MQDLLVILFLGFIGGVLGLCGGVLFLLVDKWSSALTKYSTPFAAGVMLTVSLLGLLPEAQHTIHEQAFVVTLAAFIVSYLFENLFCDLHHHHHKSAHHESHTHSSSVVLVVVGDTIHNFVDGVAIAVSYLLNPGLGIVTSISTFLHEVPHEIGDFGILLSAGFAKSTVFWINFLSSLSTLLGIILVYFFIKDSHFLGYLLAMAAGMFLYLAASDFLPRASKGINRNMAVAILLLGILVMYGTMTLVPHDQEVASKSETCEIPQIVN